MKKIILLLLFISFSSTTLFAESFVIKKIVVEGGNRVTAATVLHYLPIKRGQTLQSDNTSALLHKLYQTGLFERITFSRSGNTLIVHVVENPTLGQVKINGNSVISTEQLNDAMKHLDIVAGRILRPALLENVKQSLLHQYYQLGYFNARIEITETPLSNKRIFLHINISEGLPAKVRRITILGNHVFDEKTLIKQLNFTTSGIFTLVTHSDRYSEENLEGSLEKLRAYYMDRGYLQFSIQSSQAEITPDRKAVYVVIVVHEGETFKVSGAQVKAPSDLQAKLQKWVTMKKGDLFSREKIMQTEKDMMALLGDYGYLFAAITVHPVVNERAREVSLVFEIKPGKRIYVRHIMFTDHNRTNDEVLRREILQWESAPASMTQLEASKQRLKLLPFIREVDMSIKPVLHAHDEVDVNYQVKEDNSASATFKVGYSQIERVIFGLGFNQKNFLGTGNTFGVNFQHSKYEQFDSIEYTNPYYTPEGISRTVRVSASRVDPRGAGVNNGYTTHDYDADVLYGIPIGQENTTNRAFVGFGYQDAIVYLIPGGVSQQINSFVTSHGTHFQMFDVKVGLSRDSRDKAIFPTAGTEQSLFLDTFAPLAAQSVGYYTVSYRSKWYQPIHGPYILLTRTDFSYGNGFGGIGDYPFFRNFYAGGIDSVRGFQGYTLGPRDSNGKPFGGNILVDGSVGLIFPNPMSDNLRTSAYFDLGNVYTSLNNRSFGGQSIDSGAIRYSVGVEADVMTPFAPIRLSLARAINIRRAPSDYLEAFQFAIGANF
ncbi:MAG: outer membrane protein assembly factor BamA [Gammaproteobacteria bacterium RIFCSPHIGHO2_12_FULL_42_10]|nr:MAG: outer membrane protein assembly factor BamA [Gammaproteobacteria bacterium RIFCSPHIGHO2_12_FULL_42_10]